MNRDKVLIDILDIDNKIFKKVQNDGFVMDEELFAKRTALIDSLMEDTKYEPKQ